MPVAQQRVPVIYVAGSARELPAEVQDWLGRAEIRAVASPHIYDMLAQLARGKKFAAIIVNVQSVDWTEMEFFEYASRLSGHAPIYVTGTHQQRAKLEAACRRGARLFDALAVQEDFSPGIESLEMPAAVAPRRTPEAQPTPQPPETPEVPECESPRSMAVEDSGGRASRTPSSKECGGLLPQGGRDACPTVPGSWPRVRLAEEFEPPLPEPEEAQGPDEIETGFIDEEPGDVAEQAAAPEIPPVQPAPPADRIVEAPSVVPEPTAACCPPVEQNPPEPTAEEPQVVGSESASPAEGVDPDHNGDADANDRPTVRLVAVDEPADSEPPVMFPWSVNPNRPRRTPPQSGELPGSPPPAPPATNSSESPFKSVRLTPEEIAALMGQPPRRHAPEAQP